MRSYSSVTERLCDFEAPVVFAWVFELGRGQKEGGGRGFGSNFPHGNFVLGWSKKAAPLGPIGDLEKFECPEKVFALSSLPISPN